MKRNGSLPLVVLMLCVFLVLSSIVSARVLPPKLEQGVISNYQLQKADEIAKDEDVANLMGSREICEDDEECSPERKLLAEAHLDYIYTQTQPKH